MSRPITSRPVRRFAAAAAVLTVLLAGCGDDGSETATDDAGATPGTSASVSPTEEPTPTEVATPTEEEEATPEGPLCGEVWVDGEMLPARYGGCLDGDKWRDAFVYPCSSGQKLVTFGRTFYAAKGERITESSTPLARNAEFQDVLATCGA